ncbi:bestrophin family protein [Shimia sagamensis]|uniref:Membrane protein n=1 Tax=Shimia sagamensis TaxID=1566352 RepID=A0ABY1PQ37_9RHOB|nr:bestrophin family ion channel [Shimia sagamensis]SMP36507.1 putative membrane protein [Shimia sagamensis]
MIVRDPPSPLLLFLVMQGSVVPKIIGNIGTVTVLSVGVLLVDHHVIELPRIPIAAMGVIGVALSLFLGFRNNAAYDRWWEARRLWGALIADIRALAYQARIFLATEDDRKTLLSYAVAFAHLHRGALRKTEVQADITDWVGAQWSESIVTKNNPADAALRSMADQMGQLAQADKLSGFGQMTIMDTLSSLARSQAGCERIATTPLPFVYSLLVRRTTYLYCWLLPFALIGSANWFTPVCAAVVSYAFFGLQEVTRELEAPFHNVQNGLPLDAMCRTIEISVSETLDIPAPVPLMAKNHFLS